MHNILYELVYYYPRTRVVCTLVGVLYELVVYTTRTMHRV